ncbi:DNA (cytosine-5)-methyltransferase 1 [Tamilnaduibacter salinus]|uniref:Cytosine-specific methyltransferase n=1 Tax=Tamilnaduibacter salinus TaxID=1484056 RepID=A0A2U1CYM2_9GAMM|nr:DNA cytosine methyltransferase [Tamilnaduibacter salinus]PVY77579.1 DNA (cytosine-5)-methyltransferase 1 [Tamilnaduibacter salinus]
MKERPIAVDLFCGAGGLSLGFEQAGFDVIAAVEIDPIHAAVHKYNFPHCTVVPKSVTDVSGNQLRELSGIGGEEVDIVFGGPPCQGFSLIGQRAIDDPRNSLVKDFVRIIAELSPRYFLFENVKGLTVGKHKQVLNEIVAEFGKVGYEVRTPWRVLNAVNYCVPQERERLFLLGRRKDQPPPCYPQPTTISPVKNKIGDLLPVAPTCEEALADLPDAESFEELKYDDCVEVEAWGELSEYAKRIRCETEEDWHLGYKRDWNKGELTSSGRTNHTEISRGRFAETEPGKVEPISRFFKLAPWGVSNTLRAGTDSARGAFTSPRPIHYKKRRCITVREMARLHGFPDWFRFHKTKWHGARQIGNAVPPPLARALAQEFVRAMNINPRQPEAILELGDTRLLALDMSSAADFFGVEVAIAKRNRKSGAKKRKQEEVEAALAKQEAILEHG